jgi:N-acetylmuramoyl-L-alanine amidase
MEPGVQIRQETSGVRESLSWQLDLPKSVAQTPEKIDIQKIQVDKSDKGHRVVVTSNEPIRYQWQRFSDEDPRWWLDIPQAVLRDGKQEFALEGKYPGTVRVSQNQPEPSPVVRIVVDLEKAVEITTASGESANQLVIEVLDKELDLASAVPKGNGSTEQAAITGTGLIVIDPGHGGSDPGAVNKQLNLTEAEVTLDISNRLARILKSQGWNVVMTRTSDVDVSYKGSSAKEELGARVKVANQAKADLFVSIHCNASVSPKSAGTSLHYYKKGDYVLASTMHQAVLSSTGRNNRGVVPNRFYVLAHSQMPAVLVETAFLTNPTEGALLNDPAYRQKIAEGLAQGLRQYATKQMNWGTANK